MYAISPKQLPDGQRGVSLLSAVFLITALALLGAMASRLSILSHGEVIHEWFSSQALHAAESGVDWGGHYVQNTLFPASTCPAGDTQYNPSSPASDVVVANQSWFSVQIRCSSIDSLFIYTITSTGSAGGSSADPQTQRTLTVLYMPDS